MEINEAKKILNDNGFICEGRKKSEEDKVEDYVIAKLKGIGFGEPEWNGDEEGYEWEMDCETDGYRIEAVSLNGKRFLLSVKKGYKEIDLKVPGVRAFRRDRDGIGYHWTNYEKLLTDVEKVITYLHE